MKSFAAYFT